MRWFKRVCIFLLLAVAFFWGMLFTSENTTQVALNLVFWEFGPANMSLWIMLAFILGGLLGLIVSLLLLMKLRTHLIRAEKRADLFEKEVTALRANAVKTN